MTDKTWSNKFNNYHIHASAAALSTKKYIAAFGLEFCNSTLTKQNTLHKS